MIYKTLLRPLLFQLDPEASHERVVNLLKSAQRWPALRRWISAWCRVEDPRLEVQRFGLTFPNPIGLAAGFDKEARLVGVLPSLGFGFIEVGTVTARPQPGHPKPRLFRLPEDRALINRLGFNSAGAEAAAEQLQKIQKPGVPLGINIGKNQETPLERAITDYLYSFEKLFRYGDYFVINVSSPNTPELRRLQERARLQELLKELAQANVKLASQWKMRPRPILVKIAPDLSWGDLDELLSVVADARVAGVIATNTTLSREGLRTQRRLASESGGLSGAPLARRSNAVISYIYKHLGDQITIIGAGGVSSAEDAYEKLRAGASLIQLYTGLIYEGPSIVRRINRGLLHWLAQEGHQNLDEISHPHMARP